MLLDPAAPLRDHSKPCYRGVDNTQRTRYCGFYARAKEPCPNRAEQHRAAGSEASAIGDGFRERGWIEQAIRWHLQDAWHHHVSFDYARHAGEREAAVVGEVDAWGAVAACCFAEGVRSADGTSLSGTAADLGYLFTNEAFDCDVEFESFMGAFERKYVQAFGQMMALMRQTLRSQAVIYRLMNWQ